MTASNQHLDLMPIADPAEFTSALRQQLIDCWIAVSNAGGAAGFPFPPVDSHYVAPVADELIGRLHPDRLRLLLALAHHDHALLGWVALARTPGRLVGHWATVQHLQTHPSHRGRGVGSALMRRLHQLARDELGMEQLHLAVRGGMGLERFYTVWAGVRSAVGRARCAWPRAMTATRC